MKNISKTIDKSKIKSTLNNLTSKLDGFLPSTNTPGHFLDVLAESSDLIKGFVDITREQTGRIILFQSMTLDEVAAVLLILVSVQSRITPFSWASEIEEPLSHAFWDFRQTGQNALFALGVEDSSKCTLFIKGTILMAAPKPKKQLVTHLHTKINNLTLYTSR